MKKINRVPVILQMESLECGAASLAMILAYYKRYIPLEQLRLECGVSRDGSTAKNILTAARHNGLEAKGYRYSIDKLRQCDTFPVIIHWNYNHFVVLEGFTKKKALICDPASGHIEVDMETFEQSFTGIVLVFRPGDEFEQFGTKKSVTGFLFRYMKGYEISIILMIVIGLMTAVLSMGLPVMAKIFTDYSILGKSREWMKFVIQGMGVLLLLLTGLWILQTVLMLRAKGHMSVRLTIDFFWHTMCLPVEFFSQRSPGDISARQNDNEEVADILFEKVAPVAINAIMAATYCVLLFYYSWIMAVVVLIMNMIPFLMMKFVSRKNQNDNKNIMRDEGKFAGAAMAGVSMMETIKASGAEDGCFARISGYQTRYNNSFQRLNNRNAIFSLLPEIMSEICSAVVLVIGVNYILTGEFTIGTLIAFQGFMNSFMTPVNELAGSLEAFQSMSGKMDRIDDVMRYETDTTVAFDELTTDAECEKKLSGKIELKNVSFGYSPLAAPFIEDFSLTIEKGNTIALVGGSGSGKSTIAKLITGLYQVRRGSVCYDGKEKKEIDRYVFTESVSVVEQSIVLFQDTVRNNLTLWDSLVEEQVMVQACKDACIYQDIMSHPEGFDYMVEEGGKNFSGGQRQRLEIARAFLSNPSVLILDEATSALEPLTEQKIIEAVKRRNITCIIIAHRLSTIRDADQIIVLQDGKELERGTHEELVNAGNIYAELVKSE